MPKSPLYLLTYLVIYMLVRWLYLWQVLDVLCSLCVGNAVAVRSNQNLIMNNLMPGRDLLLQTNVVDYVYR